MTTKYTAADRALEFFHDKWGSVPSIIASAPGRVNLIGEHTDYNDGFVLPMAINRRTVVALGPGEPGTMMLVSAEKPEAVSVGLPPSGRLTDASTAWVNYVMGVVVGVSRAGGEVPGFRAAIASDVPLGSGLSSSAALEAASTMALAEFAGIVLSQREVALLSQKAEHEYAGVMCGIMDQMASVLGQVTMLDCRSLETETVTLPDGVSVVILDSAIPRGLADSAYNERRSQCEDGVRIIAKRYPDVKALRDVDTEMLATASGDLSEVVLRRCRHVVSEDDRVLRTAKLLESGDMASVGILMNQSHVSMRDDYEISLPDMDTLVEIAAGESGCSGARLTGAGFGGSCVALVDESATAYFCETVMERYRSATGREGRAIPVIADEGARVDAVN